MGIWSEDIVADMEALVAEKYSVFATGLNRKDYAGGFAYLTSPTGLLLELVDQGQGVLRPLGGRWRLRLIGAHDLLAPDDGPLLRGRLAGRRVQHVVPRLLR